jgi:hypothetical protein
MPVDLDWARSGDVGKRRDESHLKVLLGSNNLLLTDDRPALPEISMNSAPINSTLFVVT